MGKHPQAREQAGLREFVLVFEAARGGKHPAISLAQEDVQELQLAKGAMRTGIDVLLELNGLAPDEIDRVIIAGAFGPNINVASAIAVGMLPRLPLDHFEQVGNAAGMGARLALISRGRRAQVRSAADRVVYVELAAVPQIARKFAHAMYLQ